MLHASLTRPVQYRCTGEQIYNIITFTSFGRRIQNPEYVVYEQIVLKRDRFAVFVHYCSVRVYEVCKRSETDFEKRTVKDEKKRKRKPTSMASAENNVFGRKTPRTVAERMGGRSYTPISGTCKSGSSDDRRAHWRTDGDRRTKYSPAG